MTEPVDPFERALESSAAKDEEARARAIAYGRALGADAARRQGETGEEAMLRVARAAAYAAWEFDGKPEGQAEAYAQEFGIERRQVTAVADRDPFQRKEKKK